MAIHSQLRLKLKLTTRWMISASLALVMLSLLFLALEVQAMTTIPSTAQAHVDHQDSSPTLNAMTVIPAAQRKRSMDSVGNNNN